MQKTFTCSLWNIISPMPSVPEFFLNVPNYVSLSTIVKNSLPITILITLRYAKECFIDLLDPGLQSRLNHNAL